jgi:hypothetical protein
LLLPTKLLLRVVAVGGSSDVGIVTSDCAGTGLEDREGSSSMMFHVPCSPGVGRDNHALTFRFERRRRTTTTIVMMMMMTTTK